MTFDAQVLVVSAAVILASFLLSADISQVVAGGVALPELCIYKRFFGLECLGCGLTRSFVLTAHGEIGAAFGVHRLGPPFWALVAIQVPLRAWRLRPVRP